MSASLKKTLLELCIVYPETESMTKDIDHANNLRTVVEITDLKKDQNKIIVELTNNLKFAQLQSKEICVELLNSLLLDLDPIM